jgi:hypothetical protein
MADYYREAFQLLRATVADMQDSNSLLVEASNRIAEASHLMIGASQAQTRAGQKLIDATDAIINAKEEREDLRETVNRLERLVLEQTQAINELRHERDNGKQ